MAGKEGGGQAASRVKSSPRALDFIHLSDGGLLAGIDARARVPDWWPPLHPDVPGQEARSSVAEHGCCRRSLVRRSAALVPERTLCRAWPGTRSSRWPARDRARREVQRREVDSAQRASGPTEHPTARRQSFRNVSASQQLVSSYSE